MYLTLEQKQIRTVVSAVHTIAATGKTQMPILKHLLLIADATGLTLSASNEEMSIRARVPAVVQATGSALVPASFFAGFVQDLPLAPLTLVIPSPTDETAAQIRCLKIKANMKLGAMSIEEFPSLPVYPDGGRQQLLTIDCELLREIIEHVAFAAASQDHRPVLQGIRVALREGQATFAAADPFRLALRRIAIPDQHLRAEVIIPAQALRALGRLLPSTGSVLMALSATGSQALFHTTAMDVAIRLIEGAFPAYESVLVAHPSTRVVLPTHALAEAIQLSTPFARENGHQLRLRLCPSSREEAAALVLEAQAPDLGTNEIRLDEAVSVEGSELTLIVHESYLAEALAAVQTREVTLEFGGERHPIAIKPVSPLDHVSIIMPQVLPPTAAPKRTSVASVAGS